MDQKELRYFLTVCKERSLSAAAEKLYISQQGLSKAMSKLEAELQVPLFLRTTAGIRLTPYGQELEKYASPYVHQHEYMTRRIADVKENQRETLDIGFATGMFEVLPPLFLSKFLSEHPKARITIRSFPDEQCTQSILDHQLQLGFFPEPLDVSLFDSLFSKSHRLFVIAGKCHPLASRNSIRIEELASERVITLNTNAGSQDALRTICLQHGVKPSILLGASETHLMEELCLSGYAVSFYAGRMSLFSKDIVAIPLENVDFYWRFHLAANKNVYLTELALDFVQYTKQHRGFSWCD